MPSTKRVRDPIHGLIRFEAESDVDQLAWRLLDAPEMQRLRAIKQLGFLHLVFPGATHTRFGHSIGVYHVARQLLGVIRRELGPGHFRSAAGPGCGARGAAARHRPWTALARI